MNKGTASTSILPKSPIEKDIHHVYIPNQHFLLFTHLTGLQFILLIQRSQFNIRQAFTVVQEPFQILFLHFLKGEDIDSGAVFNVDAFALAEGLIHLDLFNPIPFFKFHQDPVIAVHAVPFDIFLWRSPFFW